NRGPPPTPTPRRPEPSWCHPFFSRELRVEIRFQPLLLRRASSHGNTRPSAACKIHHAVSSEGNSYTPARVRTMRARKAGLPTTPPGGGRASALQATRDRHIEHDAVGAR